MSSRRGQLGFTLIEMIIAIVVLAIALTGVLISYNVAVRGSSDALVSKQLVAIAEEMMEEILLKPFAPGPGVAAVGPADCGQAGSVRNAFDDVLDYNGYETPNICNIDGVAVAGLAGYSVRVVVVPDNTLGLGAANTLRITVTAARAGQTMVLDGFKVAMPP